MKGTVKLMPIFFLLAHSPSFSEDQERLESLNDTVVEFHLAFRSSDAERLKDLVSQDMALVTAGGLASSATEFLDGTRELLVERPDVTMELNAASVEPGPENWNVAAEQGTWVEKWTQDGSQVVLKGQYQAIWRYSDGYWRMSGLMLVPTECTGPYCE